MAEHEQLACPRCKANFECKVGSVLLCQCSWVELTQEQKEAIASQWQGCLCQRCLSELAGSEA